MASIRVGFLPFENGILQTDILWGVLHKIVQHTPILDENRDYSTIC